MKTDPKIMLFQFATLIVLVIIVYKIYQFWFEEVTAEETMILLPILIVVYFIMSVVSQIMMRRDKQ